MKPTKEEKRLAALLLHNALMDIRNNGARYQGCGICFNFEMHPRVHHTRDHYAAARLLKILAATWPDRYSGSMTERVTVHGLRRAPAGRYYPVGGCAEYELGRDNNMLWYNPRRIELLEYLIQRAEELSHEH